MISTIKLLESKLRRPIHISYISEHILKVDINETKKILTKLIEEGYVFESETSKEYYYIK